MVEPSKLLEGLFDKKRMALLKLFLDHPELEYGVREAAKASRLAPATAYRIIRTLVKMGVVDERRIKKLRLYRLNQSKETKFLDELLASKKSALEEFVDYVSALDGVDEILLHGKATKEKANVLVIGERADTSAILRIIGDIKAKYNFTILHLLLAARQYEQMSSMGLYGGEKQTLFRREADES